MSECTVERPWGLHPPLFSDAPCGRCGWVAPGPIGDARIEAIESAELMRALLAGEAPALAA
jgi:hypothetical protein